MKILWTENAANELKYWQNHDIKIVQRIKDLVNSIKTNPYRVLGKPEPLKYNLNKCWSFRITGDNRLVCIIKNKREVVILQCKYHYR